MRNKDKITPESIIAKIHTPSISYLDPRTGQYRGGEEQALANTRKQIYDLVEALREGGTPEDKIVKLLQGNSRNRNASTTEPQNS